MLSRRNASFPLHAAQLMYKLLVLQAAALRERRGGRHAQKHIREATRYEHRDARLLCACLFHTYM